MGSYHTTSAINVFPPFLSLNWTMINWGGEGGMGEGGRVGSEKDFKILERICAWRLHYYI